jgi:hypothetical protein
LTTSTPLAGLLFVQQATNATQISKGRYRNNNGQKTTKDFNVSVAIGAPRSGSGIVFRLGSADEALQSIPQQAKSDDKQGAGDGLHGSLMPRIPPGRAKDRFGGPFFLSQCPQNSSSRFPILALNVISWRLNNRSLSGA